MESNLTQELLVVEAELQDVQDQIKLLLDRQEALHKKQAELKTLLEECKLPDAAANSNISVDTVDWSGTFEWDARAYDITFNVFGITSYRANQREIINALMSGRDVLVIMAAGGGKSLCYQLPAVLLDGIALVVSPLLSLIQDQVMGLSALGIPACMLTSTTSKDDEKFIYKALEKGDVELKILYVTPEKISKSKRFMSKLEKCHKAGRLSLISIDEAHCCSQWGHDFRPDYKNLGILKIQFPQVPLIALTATATYKVQIDLMEMLHIPKCIKFETTVNRPNLFYKVHVKSPISKVVINQIADYIVSSYSNMESGIVYCFSRKECEQVARELQEHGISADYYHADMDIAAREKVHLRWSRNNLQVIVGTVAFGMGINKPDVRFVIHHSLSKSMETYYQESGRAGRDGLPSECVLYYKPSDVPRQSSMVFYENSGLQNLYDIVRYCQSKSCRRSAFFLHFGEPLQDCNDMCDNCAYGAKLEEVNVTDHAKAILSVLRSMQDLDQRATVLQLVDKLKVKMKALGAPSTPELKKEHLEQLIIQLLLDRVLKEEFQHTAYATNAYVTLGPLWKQTLDGKRIVKLDIRSGQSHIKDEKLKSSKRSRSALLEGRLDELRKDISSNHGGIFPHAVLSSQQIGALSIQKPTSVAQLGKLIGKVKAEKYGKRIIELIQQYIKAELSDGDAIAADEGEINEEIKRQRKAPVIIDSEDET
ncbi:Mediator of RNA polymerase II transcription subunit 34 [Apostasia shenzhenica]|uniref:ATP-dependent DNA helicase n=1 Tax=Apostasia shenzhenica TaxID=1088818 RepID=A0A2H9ZRR7_9ASPA|nr:Mediator of RNA polymerase II transcription subunit 34 [Apostasia shenzhenica]